MRELEARAEIAKSKLVRVLFDQLKQDVVKAELIKEPSYDAVGMNVTESVIRLSGEKINSICLVRDDGGSCGAGPVLRFQYTVSLGGPLSPEKMKNLFAITKMVKVGKVLNMFGGKVTGVTWVGQKLADGLNRDESIAGDLLSCARAWGNIDLQVAATPSGDVLITGPRFSDAERILELAQNQYQEQVQACIFGYGTMERIAGHIKDFRE